MTAGAGRGSSEDIRFSPPQSFVRMLCPASCVLRLVNSHYIYTSRQNEEDGHLRLVWPCNYWCCNPVNLVSCLRIFIMKMRTP